MIGIPEGGGYPAKSKGNMARTILIVDDNKFIVEGLHAILRKRGFLTISALGGAEALDLLSRAIPDLVLLDISMEPIDGWETLRRMRAKPDLVQLPVIVFSARGSISEEVESNSLNVSEVLAKPINTSRLLEVINRVLGQKEQDAGNGRVKEERGEGGVKTPRDDSTGEVVKEKPDTPEKKDEPVSEEYEQDVEPDMEQAIPIEEKSEDNTLKEESRKKSLESRLLEFHIGMGFENHMSDP